MSTERTVEMTPTAVMSTPVNILLVDDSPAKLLTYETMLESLGENLIKANSGREALDCLLRHEITVILTDVSMPDLDGFELAEMIRDHPRYSQTAIIFVSAVHQSDLDRLKGYASGAVDYVSVPVVPELLRAKVRVFTELYRKTREAERLTVELEARVQARTAELQAAIDRQMELAAELQEADRRKDEFLALLAHELRNPLAPVQNVVNIMLLRTSDDAELQWCRDVVARQTRQLTRLVDDLLDVSRITHGKITLRQEDVDLGSIVSNALEACRPSIDSQHHQVHVVLPAEPITVFGDATRLNQVLSNLVQNASRYQDPFGAIDVHAERDQHTARIRVRDKGFGLHADQVNSIFSLFAQGDRAARRTQGGLGVGLFLARKLVELHGGRLTATSAGPGAGSEFLIELPAVGAITKPNPIDHDLWRLPAGRGLDVLVVDDNRDSADTMRALLQRAGCSVRIAYDGSSALAEITKALPGVVLLDIGLPDMDGYEVCRRILEGHGKSVRVVALTGYGQQQDLDRSREAGFSAHTVKPIGLDELRTILEPAVSG